MLRKFFTFIFARRLRDFAELLALPRAPMPHVTITIKQRFKAGSSTQMELTRAGLWIESRLDRCRSTMVVYAPGWHWWSRPALLTYEVTSFAHSHAYPDEHELVWRSNDETILVFAKNLQRRFGPAVRVHLCNASGAEVPLEQHSHLKIVSSAH